MSVCLPPLPELSQLEAAKHVLVPVSLSLAPTRRGAEPTSEPRLQVELLPPVELRHHALGSWARFRWARNTRQPLRQRLGACSRPFAINKRDEAPNAPCSPPAAQHRALQTESDKERSRLLGPKRTQVSHRNPRDPSSARPLIGATPKRHQKRKKKKKSGEVSVNLNWPLCSAADCLFAQVAGVCCKSGATPALSKAKQCAAHSYSSRRSIGEINGIISGRCCTCAFM